MFFSTSSSLSLSSLPALLALGTALLALPWFIVIPRLALGLLFLSLIIGQLFRLPLPGQGGGLLLSDIAVVLVLLAAIFPRLGRGVGWFLLILTPFIFWSLFTLVIHLPSLPLHQFAIGLSYWLRLSTHLLLVPALLILFQNHQTKAFAIRGFMTTIIVLALLGFLQLLFIPNLDNLPGWLASRSFSVGWDPHQNRLVSTWLDPNFLGAFFVIALPFLIVRLPSPRLTSAIIFIALILTKSRGSLLALGLSLILLSPLIIYPYLLTFPRKKIPIILLTISLIFLLVTMVITAIPSRLAGLFTIDPTVTLRAQSLVAAWPLVEINPITGVGYNLYQFAAQKNQLISDFTGHSRAGTDNSYLTLLITTGLPGLFLFLIPVSATIIILIKKRLKNSNIMALAGLVSLFSLLIHANFINSLLYSHLIITIIIIITLALCQPSTTNC